MLSGVCLTADNALLVASATSGTVFLYDMMRARALDCVYDAHEMGANGCDVRQEEGSGEYTVATVGEYSLSG